MTTISKLFLANSIFFQEVTVQLGHVSLQSDAQSNQGESLESLKDLPCVIVRIEYKDWAGKRSQFYNQHF